MPGCSKRRPIASSSRTSTLRWTVLLHDHFGCELARTVEEAVPSTGKASAIPAEFTPRTSCSSAIANRVSVLCNGYSLPHRRRLSKATTQVARSDRRKARARYERTKPAPPVMRIFTGVGSDLVRNDERLPAEKPLCGGKAKVQRHQPGPLRNAGLARERKEPHLPLPDLEAGRAERLFETRFRQMIEWSMKSRY